ncbi:MAG: DUF5411 family protein [Bacilli bacterium]|jgi:hypothetical protein|nr:DUF5411 family protein [Bacilli bacterium]
MKWSTVTVGVMILGIIGVSIILLFQQLTTTNENDYYLLKEITEAAMVDSIDISYYRETGELKIVREKFIENFTRRFAESTLIIGTKYTIKFFDIMEEPPKVSVRIDTGIENYKIYNTSGNYEVLNQLTGIFEYVGKRDNGKTISGEENPYEKKKKEMTYYSIVKKSNATKKYDATLELNIPDELVSGKIKNVTLSNVEYKDSSNLTQEELNMAILQRDIYFKNANDDYDYFLTLANIEKNMYNKDSIKIDKQNKKVTIKSLTSAEKEYAIIKYIVTWQYEEYKYKLS